MFRLLASFITLIFCLVIWTNSASASNSLLNVSSDHVESDDVFLERGGWLFDEKHAITVYKNLKKYRISYEEIIGYDAKGSAQKKSLDKIDIDNGTHRFTSRGNRVCYRPKSKMNLVVLLDDNKPYKAWRIKNSRLVSIGIKGIVCQEPRDEI